MSKKPCPILSSEHTMENWTRLLGRTVYEYELFIIQQKSMRKINESDSNRQLQPNRENLECYL